MEKWPFWNENHGLTPLEKSQFFDFFNFLFYTLERLVFVLENRKTYFPGEYCFIKKDGKMAIFWTQTMGKIVIFCRFERHVFIP